MAVTSLAGRTRLTAAAPGPVLQVWLPTVPSASSQRSTLSLPDRLATIRLTTPCTLNLHENDPVAHPSSGLCFRSDPKGTYPNQNPPLTPTQSLTRMQTLPSRCTAGLRGLSRAVMRSGGPCVGQPWHPPGAPSQRREPVVTTSHSHGVHSMIIEHVANSATAFAGCERPRTYCGASRHCQA